MGDQARKLAEATFIADGMDYHLKVSRLIGNIRETPFPDWIGWCSALEDLEARALNPRELARRVTKTNSLPALRSNRGLLGCALEHDRESHLERLEVTPSRSHERT